MNEAALLSGGRGRGGRRRAHRQPGELGQEVSPDGQVIDQLADWVDRGVLRRLGLIVRHHEFGYTANAMCVWQVPPALRDAKGEALAAQHGVNLCYARPARGSHWPYNLFCMVHGKDRTEVSLRVAELNQAAGLEQLPHAVLFSTRRFKQSGALYGRMRPHAAS